MPVASRKTSAFASASASPSFELKNATLTLMALVLKTGDLEELDRAFDERFGDDPPFEHDPVVIDLGGLDADAEVDFAALLARLRRLRLVAVGVEGGGEAQVEAARGAGLGETATHTSVARAGEVATPVDADAGRPTVVVDRALRSGQQVYARGADLVVLGAVNFGAEVVADGHVHVYAPLRGRAIAGARGNVHARIFSTCMEPPLVAIAGTYRTAEHALPDGLHGKPAQVRLDGPALVFTPLG